MKKIALLALNNCLQSSITGFHDILQVASLTADRDPDLLDCPRLDPMIVTPDGRPVTCFGGLPLIPDRSISGCGRLDLIYIPVVYGDLDPILADDALTLSLVNRIRQGTMAAAVCAGVFVLAQTGALDGKAATTHWDLAGSFTARFPGIRLKPEKMLVDEGNLITAGGVTAYMDLALHLIARFCSWELAAAVSKTLLIDPVRPTQRPYTGHRPRRTHGDPEILALQLWMDHHFQAPLSIAVLADRAGLGERTLARRFKKAVGDTPLEYLQQLRLSRARTLLETTVRPVDQITWEVGYQDASSFRRLFRERTGMSPSHYRKRFSLVSSA